VLVDADCSLRAANREKVAFYRRNLALLLDALDRAFPPSTRDSAGIRWNAPAGGFFVVVDVPFRTDEALLERSAREFGVLWTPMSFFYGGAAGSARCACRTAAWSRSRWRRVCGGWPAWPPR
jgi:(S)-3,5-dihydroxyphenylglycine transaminase